MAQLGSGDALTMEHSMKLIDQALSQDRDYGDLADSLQITKHSRANASGMTDADYPNFQEAGISSVSQLSDLRRTPLPVELVEKFHRMQLLCHMGIFPEISRAWISIDSDMYVWNYEDGSDLAYFDGLSEAILCAGLLRPRPRVFHSSISHLLCLCTPVDVVILGVSFSTTQEGDTTEMNLLPEPFFTIPTDNIHFNSVCSTAEGRVFLAAADGDLYELVYRSPAEDGWFRKRCKLINHSTSLFSLLVPSFLSYFSYSSNDSITQIEIDDSRGVLYTLSERGSIQVFDLGADRQGFSRVAAQSQQTTSSNAQLSSRGLEKSNFEPIIQISALRTFESVHVHLVAITESGVRLCFTTTTSMSRDARPNVLSLTHVRLPPGFSGSSLAPEKPTKVHRALYHQGTLLMTAGGSAEDDTLWCISGDSFPFHKQLVETYESLRLDGKTWALHEIPSSPPKLTEEMTSSSLSNDAPSSAPALPRRAQPPLVVTQHVQPTRRFVVLNSQGSYILSKLTPAEQLRRLLQAAQGPDSPEITSFFNLHREDQACASALVLACGPSYRVGEHKIPQWATQAFMMHGGEPHYNVQNPLNFTAGLTSPLSPIGGNPGFQKLGSFYQSPNGGMQPNAAAISTPYPATATQANSTIQQETVYSGKHNGLHLYVGRIVRPLWETKLVYEFTAKRMVLASNFNCDQMNEFIQQLIGVRDFVQFHYKNMAPFPLLAGQGSKNASGRHSEGHLDEATKRRLQTEAQAAEKNSLLRLQSFLSVACEALQLWKLLCEHQLHVIIDRLPKEAVTLLRQMTFKQLVTTGQEICTSLIQALLAMYRSDDAVTDTISARLREICPSLYKEEDAIYSKALEMLNNVDVREVNNKQMFQEILRRFKSIATHVDLSAVCAMFGSVRFYSGVVDLALTAAAKRDPQELALHGYKKGCQQEGPSATLLFARAEAYKCITETLAQLLTASRAHPQNTSVPRAPGPAPAADPNVLTSEQAAKHYREVFDLALSSTDELFHVSLYEWLLSQNLQDQLLKIQSPFLETFLKRTASMADAAHAQLELLDLLWKYYEKNSQFDSAAKILTELADRRGSDINLEQRVEYMSRAIICAQSCTQRPNGAFLQQLEDKMEVARIQLHVQKTLQQKHRQPGVQQALTELNHELMDISMLYAKYAEPFALLEDQLNIVYTGGVIDRGLIETLWKNIIEEELQTAPAAATSTRKARLSAKIVALAAKYGSNERFFPIAFLVSFVERLLCDENIDVGFVSGVFLLAGVQLRRLYDVYHNLYKTKDPVWKDRRTHLLHVQRLLLEKFVESPNLVAAYERGAFLMQCLDSVSFYLVELQAAQKRESRLMEELEHIQAKLEKLV